MWDLLKQRFNLQKNTLIQILQKHCLIYKSFGPTIYKIEHYYVHELVDLEKGCHGLKKGPNVWEASE